MRANTKTYGEFENVFLTESEVKKLNERFGEDFINDLIEDMSCGIESKGYIYVNHYPAAINWAKRKLNSAKSKSISEEESLRRKWA